MAQNPDDTSDSNLINCGTPRYIPMSFDGWPFLSEGAKKIQPEIAQQVELLHIFGDADDLLSALFVTTNDVVYGVGRNDFGRLGIGLEDANEVPDPQIIDTLSGKRVISFASGSMHVLALTEAGEVFSWGLNILGPLGNGTTLSRSSPGRVLSPWAGTMKIKAIAARNSYSLAVTFDNSVYHWGDTLFTECSVQNLPTLLLSFDNIMVVQIACSCSHAALLTSDGHIRVWGDVPIERPHGENVWSPEVITNPMHRGITSIACTWFHTVALTASGKVYVFHNPSSSEYEPDYLDCQDQAERDYRILEIAGTSHFCSPIVFRTGGRDYLKFLPPFTEEPDVIQADCNIQSAFMKFPTPQVFRAELDAINVYEIQGPSRSLVNLFNKKELSDLKVQLSDGEIYVHKLILVAFCEHFKYMLTGAWSNQSNSEVLDMTHYNPRAYRAFLKYLYLGCLDLRNGEDLIDLYDIAKGYLEGELLEMCSKMITTVLEPNNVATLYEKASKHNFVELTEMIAKFAGSELRQVISSDAFTKVDPAVAKKLVVEAVSLTKTVD